MKNILLVCMSPVNLQKLKCDRYSYKLNPNDKHCKVFPDDIYGFFTNEAPAKSVIKQLAAKNQKLDKIVAICSEQAMNSLNQNELSPLFNSKKSDFVADNNTVYEDISTYDYFCNSIENFAQKTSDLYKGNPIVFEHLSIGNTFEDEDVFNAIIGVDKNIIGSESNNEKICLHIDSNGGQRSIAYMLVALAHIMTVKGVDLSQVMFMNYTDGVIPIQNLDPIFRITDFISGIKEYVNYGRVNTLKAYFADSNNDIKKCIAAMENFANALQLCRTDEILDKKTVLYNRLKKYIEKYSDTENASSYQQIFLYAIEYILDSSKELFEGSLPQVIKWCVEHDFIQQAITLCSEELPHYFYENNIFAPTEAEKKEFENFVKVYNDLVSHPNTKGYEDAKVFDRYIRDAKTRPHYCWMINYLTHSSKYTKIYPYISADMRKLMSAKVYLDNQDKNLLNKFKAIDIQDANINAKNNSKAYQAAEYLLAFYARNTGRVTTCLKKDELFNVIVIYEVIKDLRNQTNHALGGNFILTYNQIKNILINFCDFLISKQVVKTEPAPAPTKTVAPEPEKVVAPAPSVVEVAESVDITEINYNEETSVESTDIDEIVVDSTDIEAIDVSDIVVDGISFDNISFDNIIFDGINFDEISFDAVNIGDIDVCDTDIASIDTATISETAETADIAQPTETEDATAVQMPSAETTTEEKPVEDSVAVEPVEEVTIEETVVEEPAVEEPAVEEPTVEEPVVEEPAVEEPELSDVKVCSNPNCNRTVKKPGRFCPYCGTKF